jgi:uncharacterized protein (TIRG00374 family)
MPHFHIDMVNMTLLQYAMMALAKNTRQLLVFLIFTLVSITIICVITFSEETINALRSIQPFYFAVIILLWIFIVFSDSVGMKMFVNGTGEKLSLKEGVKLHFVRVFFNLITPFTFGGQPFIVMLMRKSGIPSGKGSSIVITRLLSFNLFSSCGGIFALIYFGDAINQNPALSVAFYLSGFFFIFLFVIAIAGLLIPPLMVFITNGISRLFHRLHIIKDIVSFREKAYTEIHNARNSFINYFSKHIKYLLGGTLLCGCLYGIQIAIMFMIFQSIGISFTLIHGFASCALLFFLIGFMPTPGASGIGDVIFLIIFANSLPKCLLGIAVILWRTFYQFLSAIGGAIYSSRFFSRMLVKDKKP